MTGRPRRGPSRLRPSRCLDSVEWLWIFDSQGWAEGVDGGREEGGECVNGRLNMGRGNVAAGKAQVEPTHCGHCAKCGEGWCSLLIASLRPIFLIDPPYLVSMVNFTVRCVVPFMSC